MITASSVYETLLTIARKDKRGKSLSPDEYNQVAVKVNRDVFDDYYKQFEENIDSSDTMSYFKVFDEQIFLVSNTNNTASVGSLPDDYYHIIGRPKTISGSTVRFVDIVTAQEHAKRAEDYLTQPTATHPTCQIGGVNVSDDIQINVYPYTITSIYMDYLRVPATPYLDYYINDTTLNLTFMAQDATVSVPVGSTYRDGTVGGGAGIASITQNWEYSTEDLSLILAKFAIILGIQLPDEVLIQAGTLSENKILAQ